MKNRDFLNIAIIAIGATTLSACAGAKYAIDNYSGVEIQQYTASDGGSWRIFDRPEENRLMITPSLGQSAAGGFVKGATFGIANATPTPVIMQQRAEDWLKSIGRDCLVISTVLIIDPQYEARYRCDLPSVTSQSASLGSDIAIEPDLIE